MPLDLALGKILKKLMIVFYYFRKDKSDSMSEINLGEGTQTQRTEMCTYSSEVSRIDI